MPAPNKTPNKYDSWLSALLMLPAILWFSYYGHQYAYKAGWISHTERTTIQFPEHGWENGEYVTCSAWTISSVVSLECGGNHARQMDVDFYGVIPSFDKNPDEIVQFQCHRDADSISCRRVSQQAKQ